MKYRVVAILLVLLFCIRLSVQQKDVPNGDAHETTPLAEENRRAPSLPEGNAAPAVRKPAGIRHSDGPDSIQWHDPESTARRARTRIAKADFKYGLLRYEEVVWIEDGEEKVDPVTTSVADHLIVKLLPGVDAEAFRAALPALGLRIRAFRGADLTLVEIPAPLDPASRDRAMESLGSLKNFVSYSEPDYLVFPSATPNDPEYASRMWPLDNTGVTANSAIDADIDAAEGWDTRNAAPDVIVAVTDTGVRYTHEDLAQNMWQHSVTGDFGIDTYDDDNDPMDADGHGTHVAGIIGARGNNSKGITGVAWEVQLMALRFLGENGGATSDAIHVIDYARENGADIINASWGGGGQSRALMEAIVACNNSGILFVAAAGNTGADTDITPQFPSSFALPNIVSVGATDSRDRVAPFSNYGYTTVDLTAPGVAVWSCGIESDTAYRYLSGTSMAAPHVSGALALAMTHFPSDAPDELAVRLLSSVEPVIGHTGKFAYGGRLNLHRLLTNSQSGNFRDDFGNPYVMRGCMDYWCWVNRNATREPGEDVFSPDTGNRSFWFKWIAPADGLVSFKGSAWGEDVSVVAFAGSEKNSLTRLSDNFAERPANASTLRFYVKAGQEYRFSLDSRSSINQVVAALLVFAPEYDFFDEAQVIATSPFNEEGLISGATAEPFEIARPHAGVGRGESIWWRWTADSDGPFTISTRESRFDSVLAVYTGSKNSLTEIASNDDRSALDYTSEVTFNAVQGTTYHIAVDSYRSGHTGTVFLYGYKPGTLRVHSAPEDTFVGIGEEIDFRVVATGDDLSYRWLKDGIRLAWPTDRSSLHINPVEYGSYGDYIVEVRSGDEVIEVAWELSPPQSPPFIQEEPKDTAVLSGGTLALSPTVGGTPILSFQWFKDGNPLAGANGRVLQIASADAGDAGDYHLEITNANGFCRTRDAQVVVNDGTALNWVRRLPDPRNSSLIDGVSHGGRLHFVAAEGVWLSGNRSDSLQASPIPGMRIAHMIRSHGAKLVAIGHRLDGASYLYDHLAVSEDGKTWATLATDLPAGKRPTDFASDGTNAVMLVDGLLYASQDLVNWQLAAGYAAGSFEGLEWLNGLFVAIRIDTGSGSGSSFQWATSTDGLVWTNRVDASAQGYGGRNFQAVGGKLFLSDRNNAYRKSEDGIVWTHGHTGRDSTSGLVFFDGRYVSVGGDYSSDGSVWANAWGYTSDFGSVSAKILVHDGKVVRYVGSPYESEDPLSRPPTASLESAAVHPGALVKLGSTLRQISVYGDQGNYSADGVDWGRQSFSTLDGLKSVKAKSIGYDGAGYWVISEGELSSPKGLFHGPSPSLLSEVPLPTTMKGGIANVYARNGHVLITGVNLASVTRDQGASWGTASALLGNPELRSTVATDSGFVVVTASQAIFSKDGGVTWQTYDFNLAGHRSGPVPGQSSYSGGELVVLDQEGYLRITTDEGSSWTTLDLGEPSWVSVTHFKGGIHALNADGRVLTTTDRSTFTTDGGLSFVERAIDLEGYGDSLFAVVALPGATYAIYESGSSTDTTRDLQVSGISDQAIYSPGTEVEISWEFLTQGLTPDGIEVFLDGVSVHISAEVSGRYGIRVPESGEHHVVIAGTTAGGDAVTKAFTIYSRAENMNLLTSSEGAAILDQRVFQGALYVTMKDGRILRTGDGESFDLATNLPQPPKLMIATEGMLGVFTSKAFYMTRDGIQWKAVSMSGISPVTDHNSISPIATQARIIGGSIYLKLSSGESYYSENGTEWRRSIFPEFTDVTQVQYEGVWLGGSYFEDFGTVLIASGETGSRLLSYYLGENPRTIGANGKGFVAAASGGIHHSVDGVTWQRAALPISGNILVTQFRNVSGYLVAEYGSPLKYLVSGDGLSWTVASRLPDLIHEGIWWQGNSKSVDGVNWSQEGPSGAVKTVGFIGDRRITATTVSATTQLSFSDAAAFTAIDTSHLFTPDFPWAYGDFKPNSSLIGPDGLWYLFEDGAFVDRFSVRQANGQWTIPATIARIPTDVFGGGFIARGIALAYYYTENLQDWQSRTLNLSTTNDFSITRMKVLQDRLYVTTFNNIHSSSDGLTWEAVYVKGVHANSQPGDLGWFDGKLLFLGSSSPYLFIRNEVSGSWGPPASPYPNLRPDGSFVFTMNDKLHIKRRLEVHSTGDLVNWDLSELPFYMSSTSGSAAFSPLQVSLSSGGDDGRVATLETDGVWIEQKELGQVVGVLNVDGRIVHHRANQTWIQGLNDIGIEVTDIQHDEVALNSPMTVAFALENRGDSAFTVPQGSQVRLWALAEGVMNYQTRLLLGTVGIGGQVIPAGGTTALERIVQLPDGTPPGSYVIAAELRNPAGTFDDYAANNIGSSRERLELAARTLTLNSIGNGAITSDNVGLVYSNGALISLFADAGKGARFTGWGGDSYGSRSQITLTMDSDKTVEATFVGTVGLQLFVRGWGTVTGLTETGLYPVDSTAVLNAVPAAGWVFSGWSGDYESGLSQAAIPMPAPRTVAATFSQPLTNWKSTHFNPTELGQAEISGNPADPDHDGVTNWQEYLHGSNPRKPESTGFLSRTLTGNHFIILFTRNSGSVGGRVSATGSRDLAAWDANLISERILSVAEGIETVEVRIPRNSLPAYFLRMSYDVGPQ